MSTDNTDKAQDKEEDYDIDEELTTEELANERKYQRAIQPTNRDDLENADNLESQFSDEELLNEYEEEDGLMPFSDPPPREMLGMEEETDSEVEDTFNSRFEIDDELTAQERKSRLKQDIEYFNEMHKEYRSHVQELVDERQETDYGKLQSELIELIKAKVDNGDKKRAQKFVSKLRALVEQNAKLKIDAGTLAQIEELFINRQGKTEYEILAAGQTMDTLIDEQVTLSVSDRKDVDYIPGRDTFKDEPIEYKEYEEFVMQSMIEANNMNNFGNVDEEENITDVLSTNELTYTVDNFNVEEPAQEDDVDLIIENTREELYHSTQVGSPDEIKELVELIDQYNDPNAPPIDPEERTFDIILNSITIESTTMLQRLEEQYSAIMRQKGINHDEKDDNQPLENIDANDKRKAELGQALQQQHEVDRDIEEEIIDELQMQFDQNHLVMRYNAELRKKLVNQVRQARQMLKHIQNMREKITQKLAHQGKQSATDAIPGGIYDFTKHNESIIRREQLKALNILHTGRQFNPQSRNIDNFNHELNLLIKIHEYQQFKDKSKTQKMIGKVLSQMQENNVKPNEITDLRLFEYAVISKNPELANQKLRDITYSKLNYEHNIIDPSILKKFYKQALRQDNFTGLAHLINYADTQQLDICSWPLSQFQSALNFYLNHSFDLTKVLTFTRYYTSINDCRLNKALKNDYQGKAIDQLTDIQKGELHAKVFGESDSLIDMRSTFSVLVDQVGQKDAVDPFTKQDALWSLIDFFTRRGMAELMQKGENNYSSLNERDIAKYFKNHINSSKTFERSTNLMLRFDGKGDTFQNAMIQVLKEYQANNNGSLPYSFEPHKVRDTYRKLQNAQSSLGTKFSEKTVEYFLEVFSALKMWPEVADICSNFSKFTGLNGELNELRQHYLTTALLAMPQDQHYYQAVQQKAFNGKEELNPSYITSMTKAYLQDGSISHGIKFFQESVQKLGSMRKSREDYLVSLFDSVFGEEAAKDLTYEQFKDKYLQTILMSEQSLKEAKAYTTLKEAIKDKSYQDIDKLLSLYIVQSEELQLLEKVRDKMGAKTRQQMTIETLQNSPIDNISDKYISESERKRLEVTRERRLALKDQVTLDDYNKIIEIKNIMGDKKFMLLSGMKTASADDIQSLFNLRSKAEIDDILEKTSAYYEAANSLTKQKFIDIMDTFHQVKEQKKDNIMEGMRDRRDDLTYKSGSYKKNKGKQGQQVFDKATQQAAIQADGGDDNKKKNKKNMLETAQQMSRQEQQELESLERMISHYETIRDIETDSDMEESGSDEEGVEGVDVAIDADDGDDDDLVNTQGSDQFDADQQEVFDQEEGFLQAKATDKKKPKKNTQTSVLPSSFGDGTKITITSELIEELKENEDIDEQVIYMLEDYEGATIDLRQGFKDKLNYERIDPNVWANLRSLYKGRQPASLDKIEEAMDSALIENYDMFEDNNIDDPFDPQVIAEQSHNDTVNDLQDELLEAVSERRKDVLEVALKLFNRIQDRVVPQQKLNKLNQLNNETAKNANINQTLDLCKKLLTDSRSPLISALNTFVQYKGNQIESDFEDFIEEVNEDWEETEFDIEYELLSQKHLIALTHKLSQTTSGLSVIQKRLIQESQNIDKVQQLKEDERKLQKEKKIITEQLENKIKNLYEQYQKKVQGSKSLEFANELSRDAKLELLGDLFAVEYNNQFTNNLFPAFYSQDLIIFGLQNNIPEAVRLGEQMMSQNGQTLPREMQVAVREYMLSNQAKYRQAMKNTGPIDNASLYKQVNRRNNGEQPVMMVADDPYWINIARTSYKRSEAWKRPSFYAYDYKQNGIMSEIAPHLTDDYIRKQTQYMKNMF